MFLFTRLGQRNEANKKQMEIGLIQILRKNVGFDNQLCQPFEIRTYEKTEMFSGIITS